MGVIHLLVTENVLPYVLEVAELSDKRMEQSSKGRKQAKLQHIRAKSDIEPNDIRFRRSPGEELQDVLLIQTEPLTHDMVSDLDLASGIQFQRTIQELNRTTQKEVERTDRDLKRLSGGL